MKYLNLSKILIIILFTTKISSHGAGVLPYSVDKNNNVYFYISREVAGKSKKTYSDFGGLFEPSDINLYNSGQQDEAFKRAAAREFSEESMSVMYSVNGKKLNEKNTLDLLNTGTNVYQVTQTWPSFSYRMFLMPIKNDVTIFKKFAAKRQQLIAKLQKLPPGSAKAKAIRSQLEKDVIASVKSKDLINTLSAGSSRVKIAYSSNKNIVPNNSIVKLRSPFKASLIKNYNNKVFKKIISKYQKKPKKPKKPKDINKMRNDLSILSSTLSSLSAVK